MNKSNFLLVFIVSFFVGIFFASIYIIGDLLRNMVFVLFLILFIFRFGLFSKFTRVAWMIILLGVLCGIFRFFISFESGENFVANYEGYFEVSGCISEEVDVRNDKIKYVIDAESIKIDGVWVETLGKVLLTTQRYPVYEYADCFAVSGELKRPEKFEGFAYDKYLARYGIYTFISSAQIELLDKKMEGVKVLFFKTLYRFKSSFETRLAKVFLEPHNSFMAGLILGSRKGIAEHLMEDFNATGLTHIIAISGYNITLIIVIVAGLFSFLERRLMILFSILFVFIFVLLVGASAAVVRAGIMGVISLVALWHGRKYYVTLGLFLAAFFMNLFEPKILVYDVGFQLSFLATCGLLYVSPLIEKYFMFLPKKFEIRESVLMTISAQILALPVILMNFERLSLISPVANLFVLPFLPFSMLFGFLAVIASYMWFFLAQIFGFVGFLLLEVLVFFVKFFANVKFASVEVTWFFWWVLLIYYYFVVGFIMRRFDQ